MASLEQLPVEIILNIVIQLGWKPGDIESLLVSSKVNASSHLCPASTLTLLIYFATEIKIRLEDQRRAALSTVCVAFLPNVHTSNSRLLDPALGRPQAPISAPLRTKTHSLTLPPPLCPLSIHLSLDS